ncbi:HIR complex subunit [Komagataella phaffii CBS 7435]|uniref:Protein HIR n=2 Tax=Komagataella phaffii TaxID=460519 RepID=C4R2E4_KOMPG|nr:Subunit of the HIR complex, a nucleosome assembly complex involved in histone gene transcription [Komagataella phaffii GS115]CAH2447779.1 HIR complex subunit [Komagataella phaffii CBS 7435]CAY69668.1 Subunit of the HIR complex, a nucleosome assembly complex involved in histone gene transcription [Komagataella phaffii GS115]CCA37956.2 HIR complex subunit [Komagataella phaffii CBS 7435]
MKLVRLPSRGIKDVSVNSDDQVITAGKQLTLHDPPSIDSIDLPVKQVLVNKPVDLAKFAKLDVHKEQICYTAENEVFLLPSFGKEPQLLIKDQGTVRNICWSSDDVFIAITLTKGKILIFQVEERQVFTTLELKEEVRGAVFDDKNDFFCTLSDTLTIFSLPTFTVRQNLDSLLSKNLLAKSVVKMPSFSHDSKCISVPNASKSTNLALVSILHNTRKDWKTWCSFVGHKFLCDYTSFNPLIFTNTAADSDLKLKSTPQNNPYFYILATGGSDQTLAIWNTSLTEPVLVVRDIVKSEINNLTWSRSGSVLYVLSTDGELCIIQFVPDELGKKSEIKINVASHKRLKVKEQPQDKNSIPTPIKSPSTTPPDNQISKTDPTAKITTFDQPNGLVPSTIKHQIEKDENNDEEKKRRKLDSVEFIGSSVVINPSNCFSKVRLGTPKVRLHFTLESESDNLTLDVKNGQGNESSPTKITLYKKIPDNTYKEIFADFIPKRVMLSTGGYGPFWSVCTTDGTVIVYSYNGRRVLPPLVLGTPLSFLQSKNQYLMAVTSLGELHVWDLEKKTALFDPTSLYPILKPRFDKDVLSRSENLTLCSITSEGVPVVTLSNGNGYLFNISLRTWNLVSDSWWALGSQYWDSTNTGDKDRGVNNLLERNTNEELLRKGKGQTIAKFNKLLMMKEGYGGLETIVSLSHLENKLMCFKVLKEKDNYHKTFMIYVKRICELGIKNRLLEICEELYETDKKVLRELIETCSEYRKVQRILLKYNQILEDDESN